MNIVSLGTDRNVFEPHSAVAKRLVRYGAGVDRYTVVVPCGKTQHLRLSNTVSAQGVASHGKISAFFALYFFFRKPNNFFLEFFVKGNLIYLRMLKSL